MIGFPAKKEEEILLKELRSSDCFSRVFAPKELFGCLDSNTESTALNSCHPFANGGQDTGDLKSLLVKGKKRPKAVVPRGFLFESS